MSRDSSRIDELCKDVSSFANSAGGILIYGMHEDKSVKPPKPTRLEGITDPKITGEWIDNILSSRIQPRLDAYRIYQVPLQAGGVVYVIDVAQSTTRAPHQAPDRKYYRRFEFHAEPMADYEIRDAMGRAAVPDLFLSFALPEESVALQRGLTGDRSQGIRLDVSLHNDAHEPAPYATIAIDLDASLWFSIRPTPFHGDENQQRWKDRGQHAIDGLGTPRKVRRLVRNYGHPGELPLFYDNPQTLEGSIVFGVPTGTVERSYADVQRFYLGWSVKAARMTERHGLAGLSVVNGSLRLVPMGEETSS